MELPCEASDTLNVNVRYRWTQDGVVVGESERLDGTLVIPAIRENQLDNGLYRCRLVVRVSGVDAAPLIIPAASTIVTVGSM